MTSNQPTDYISTPVTVRGQIYLPNGVPLQQSIRFQLLTDDASRPPEYIFTDSGGQFVLQRLVQMATYIIIVEGDAQNWGPTTARFMVGSGRQQRVQVYLEPPERKRGPEGPSVSAYALRQKLPRAARKQFEAALRLIKKGDYVAAQPSLERAVALFPDYVEARNELGVALMKAGKLADAEEHLRRALGVDAAAVRPMFNLGLCLQRQQRFADAQPYLERAVQLRPDHAGGLLSLGINAVMLRDDARAEPLLVRAYDLGGASVASAQLYLAQLYTRRKDYARAATALETYLRDVPSAPDGPRLQQVLDQLRAAAQRPQSP